MRKWVRVLLVVGVLVYVRSLAAAQGGAELRFELYGGYTIVVRGSIADLKQLNFIVDTGAVPSVVDLRVARKLRLEGQVERLSLFSQAVETRRVMLPNLVVGSVDTGPFPVLVEDLASLEPQLGVRIDGMIGLDALARDNIVIDYDCRTIAFSKASGKCRGRRDLALTSVPFELGPGYAMVKLEIEGEPVRLMVDTGARSLVLFAPRVQDRLAGIHKTGGRAIGNLGGTFALTEVVLPDASLGPLRLHAQKAALMEGRPPDAADLDGLLGVRSLCARGVGFDFEHKAMTCIR